MENPTSASSSIDENRDSSKDDDDEVIVVKPVNIVFNKFQINILESCFITVCTISSGLQGINFSPKLDICIVYYPKTTYTGQG